jgi:hypothetical protein
MSDAEIGSLHRGILTDKNDAATKKDLNELSEVAEEKSYESENDNEMRATVTSTP